MENQPPHNSRRASGRHLSRHARAEHLARWEQSGLTARAYAREHAISYKSLYAWRSQSRRRASGDSSRAPDGGGAPAFVPVRVSALANNTAKDPLTVILRTGALECVLSGAANHVELVSLIKSLKQEVFDV